MKKIVLVKIEQESETNHPLALLFLVNSLRKSNFETKILLGRTQNFDPDDFVLERRYLRILYWLGHTVPNSR